ncbi:universal stress protein [Variovorax sp. NFACC27]|jgi:nucleotide-binding universal stress UspA family protein|uniref:Universal stress protein n=1 Tax=Variovorax gossypii TaxID=1679495 RepID=A0A431TKA4_9BURK|nr:MULTISPECIES: universal stress protein [Variovorax]MDP9607656.1 nucleotide-binding universal stress UspA family protein [Variovorax paradoxus]SEF34789.1 Nucleotide-binding universal stress protein, UspA family [Variovorax sp. NFACC28]SEG97947.1 Nucleotide-binding universal stress protein, UspA family [Variovorax sp. NFACC29]SFE03034.1 Nucleotide-binding universal stress protein, UspA family [Variovorax sp. NFACC26]SFH24529.1 Nucleotide-binding universal stress protein, UspA family [Variovor
MYKRVLVATDGSALSEQAVKAAIDLALLTNADLVSVTVAHIEPVGYFEGSMMLSQRDIQESQAHTDRAAQQLVDKVAASALAKGVRSAQAIVMRSNQVAEAIITTAKNQQCDLIVMASHGRRSLARLLMGSETLHVLTHSHIPVLVLR